MEDRIDRDSQKTVFVSFPVIHAKGLKPLKVRVAEKS